MTRTGESERTLRGQAVISAIAAVLAVLTAGTWAMLVPAAPPLPNAMPGAITAARPGPAAAIDTAAWQVALWRPFSDAPPPVARAAPLTIKVFSILRQGGGATAALDPGNGAGLVYARVGQRIGELTVTAIDEHGIEVESGGQRQRLELTP